MGFISAWVVSVLVWLGEGAYLVGEIDAVSSIEVIADEEVVVASKLGGVCGVIGRASKCIVGGTGGTFHRSSC